MMKRLLAAGSICVFLFLGVIGCGGESMAGYQKIPAAEAKNRAKPLRWGRFCGIVGQDSSGSMVRVGFAPLFLIE